MGRLLQLLIMFGPQLMRAYQRYQRQQDQNERRYGDHRRDQQPRGRSYNPVSYTHLTLPTICSV